jgi:hypothetical protein
VTVVTAVVVFWLSAEQDAKHKSPTVLIINIKRQFVSRFIYLPLWWMIAAPYSNGVPNVNQVCFKKVEERAVNVPGT